MEKATFVGKLRAMMRIDIITVLPELLQSPLNYSILKRAQDKKLVEIVVHNLRDYSLDKHRRVDPPRTSNSTSTSFFSRTF